MGLKVVNDGVSGSIWWHGRGKGHVSIGGLSRLSNARQQCARGELNLVS